VAPVHPTNHAMSMIENRVFNVVSPA
jgi:hypothetical protein